MFSQLKTINGFKFVALDKTKIFSFKYEGKKMKCDSISMTSFSNKYLRNTDCFEDATNVLNWRYQNSLTATQVIYNLYKNERCISDIKKNKTGRPRYFPFKAPNGKFFMIRTQEYYLLVT